MSSDQDTGKAVQNQYSDDGDQHPQRESVISQGAELHNQEVPKNEVQEQSSFNKEGEDQHQEKQNCIKTETIEGQLVTVEVQSMQKSEENVEKNEFAHEQGENEYVKNQENGNEKPNKNIQNLNEVENKQNSQIQNENVLKQQQRIETYQNEDRQGQDQSKHLIQEPILVLEQKQANYPVNGESQSIEDIKISNNSAVDDKDNKEQSKQQNGQMKEQTSAEVQVQSNRNSQILGNEDKVVRSSLQSKYLINQRRDEETSQIEEKNQPKIDKEQTRPLLSAPPQNISETAPLEIEQNIENYRKSTSKRMQMMPSVTNQNKKNIEKPAGKDPGTCGNCNVM